MYILIIKTGILNNSNHFKDNISNDVNNLRPAPQKEKLSRLSTSNYSFLPYGRGWALFSWFNRR